MQSQIEEIRSKIKLQDNVLKRFDLDVKGLNETTKSNIDAFVTFKVLTNMSCMEKSFLDEFRITQNLELIENKQKTYELESQIIKLGREVEATNNDFMSLENSQPKISKEEIIKSNAKWKKTYDRLTDKSNETTLDETVLRSFDEILDKLDVLEKKPT